MGLAKPPLPQLQRGHPLARGLVGAWPFTEGSGGTVYDLAQRSGGADGTLNGPPAWVGGRFGSALSFNGSTDYVNTGGKINATLNGGSEISMACWFKGTLARSCVRLQSTGYAVLVWNNGANRLSIISNDGGTAGLNWNAGTIEDGNWHFLLMSWKLSGTFAIYTDGALTASRGASASTINLAGGTAGGIGARGDGAEKSNGLIDLPMIWARALPAHEVAQLYFDTAQIFRRRRILRPSAATARPYSYGHIFG